MDQATDIKFMTRAMELADSGQGHVNPNPLVGAVLVKDGEIIGEGYHKIFGEAHAEIIALNNAKKQPAGATLYVTMEPCNHHGKTPPCTNRIIKEKIKRVVIGMRDPNPAVAGNGLEKLQSSGIEVTEGVLKNAIEKQNEVFKKYTQTSIPFCALKTAMTLDGKISTFTGDSKWISNDKSRAFVHQLRHRFSAIMTGVNTVIKDNPMLNDRSGILPPSHPIRIIVDSNGRTPENAKLLNHEAKTIIAITAKASDEFQQKMKKKGVELIICPEKNQKVDLKYLLKQLGEKGIDSILLEGGSTLNFSALQQGIIDKVYSFISAKMVGGKDALTPMGGAGFKKIDDAINLNITDIKKFENDIMVEAYIIKS